MSIFETRLSGFNLRPSISDNRFLIRLVNQNYGGSAFNQTLACLGSQESAFYHCIANLVTSAFRPEAGFRVAVPLRSTLHGMTGGGGACLRRLMFQDG